MKTRFARVLTAVILVVTATAVVSFGQLPNISLDRGRVLRPDLRLRLPDLVVTRIAAGRPVLVGGAAEVPLTVTVRNQGLAAAGPFKVSVDYTPAGAAGSFVVAFTVPGEASIWYPSTDAPLAVGASTTFTGRLRFHPATHGRVSLRATADSCSGEEFVEAFCHVRESNEANNKSAAVWVALP